MALPEEEKRNDGMALVGAGLLGGAAAAMLLRPREQTEEQISAPAVAPARQLAASAEGKPNDLRAIGVLLQQILDTLRQQQIQASPQVAPSIPAFISVEDLNKMLQAAGRPGTSFPVYRVATLVPASSKVTLTLNVPRPYVDTRQTPLELSSDYYDPGITVNIFVDVRRQSVTPNGIALTGPTRVDFGQFYVKRSAITIEITNNTLQGATVSYQVQPALMLETIYDGFYQPIIGYGLRQLGNMARAMGGDML